MYEVADTTYCYPDTSVLKHKRDIRDAGKLQEFELAMTSLRVEEDFKQVTWIHRITGRSITISFRMFMTGLGSTVLSD